MLLLFFGPSCVGKTTVMDYLMEALGWVYVPTTMTRPLRGVEAGKRHVSDDEFNEMLRAGEFLCTNHLYGYKYGTPLSAIQAAVDDQNQVYMMDFPLSQRENVFGAYRHYGVILLPTSEEQLQVQAMHSGRSDRLTEILSDYRTHYEGFHASPPPACLTVVLNMPEMLHKTTAEIASFVEGVSP
jgi:guanylate kinase